MKDRSQSLGRLPPNLFLRVDALCNRFEEDWRAGRRPRLEDYLVDEAAPEYKILLEELILIDAAQRLEAAEVPAVAEYAERFPALETAWFEDNLLKTHEPQPVQPAEDVKPASDLAPTASHVFAGEDAGTIIGGRFKLLEQIGEGGMGYLQPD